MPHTGSRYEFFCLSLFLPQHNWFRLWSRCCLLSIFCHRPTTNFFCSVKKETSKSMLIFRWGSEEAYHTEGSWKEDSENPPCKRHHCPAVLSPARVSVPLFQIFNFWCVFSLGWWQWLCLEISVGEYRQVVWGRVWLLVWDIWGCEKVVEGFGANH